jgi:UDPglucose--hexose-1-phosphate uridylyltransferase
MKRTITQLADGRELIYYDADDGLDRSAPDLRTLTAPTSGPEMRRDRFTGDWIGIATHRNTRTFLPASDECPLCPSTASRSSEIPSADYDVAVFENRFPSFSRRPPGNGALAAAGRCEVLCFTSRHDTSFGALDPQRVRLIVEAWVDRTAELSAIPAVEQVFCFENRGVEIGVTLHHPHGQIYAYPFITPYTQRMLAALADDRRMFAEAVAGADDRVVAGNDEWIAFVPYAARWPFEVLVFPRRPVPDLTGLTDAARDAFGPLYLDLLHRFDGLFGKPMPYISGWYQAPKHTARERWWLHLRLFSNRRAADKLKYPAGSESAMGAFINDIRPEDAASMLRRAA